MDDEPDEIGIPEWVVTFGDMMSLLLTFFIMLVSLSEIKEEESYQALVDSMQQQFGYQKTLDALTPGEARPRSSEFAVLSTTGRAKLADTHTGGVPDKAPVGDNQKVRIIRPGQLTAIGGVVFFDLGSDELSPGGKEALQAAATQLIGKPQRIEVRGHVSPRFAARTVGTDEATWLAMRRAAIVRNALVNDFGLPPERFRLSSAEANEPMTLTDAGGNTAASDVDTDGRVEVFLLDETPRGRL